MTNSLISFKDGWGDLFDATTIESLRMPAFPNSSKIDVKPYISAYKNIGIVNSAFLNSIDKLINNLNPRIVSTNEFENSVEQCAHLLYAMMEGKNENVLFLIEKGRKIKSGLWIFLKLMHYIKKKCKTNNWIDLRDRINLFLYPYTDRKLKLEKPTILVFTDDCVYSGFQLQHFIEEVYEILNESVSNIKHAILCPIYSTKTGLDRIFSTLLFSCQKTICVPQMIGYISNLERRLGKLDFAICARLTSKSQWMIFSLYNILGILEYDIILNNNNYYDAWFRGNYITVRCRMIGHTHIIFQHKIADSVSIPTTWFTLGITMKRAIELMNPIMESNPKSLSHIEISVLPMTKVIKILDDNAKNKKHWKKAEYFNNIEPNAAECIAICDADLIPSQYKNINLSKLPDFVPLLQPGNSCGKEFGEAKEKGNTDWYYAQLAHTMDNICFDTPYKSKLQNIILKLVKKNKSLKLAKILNIEHERIRDERIRDERIRDERIRDERIRDERIRDERIRDGEIRNKNKSIIK